jgi:hypothetical protein
MKRKPPPVWEVHWTDTATRAGWTEHRDKETGTIECWTVGYLLEKTDEHIVLSGSWNEGQRADTTTIDAGAVKSYRELRK